MADTAITLDRSAQAAGGFHRAELTLKVETIGAAKLRIYGAAADTRFRDLMGIEAPAACRQVEREGLTFAWMAPGEWLVTGPEGAVAGWLSGINDGPNDDLLAVDITHGRTCFLLGGAHARAALAAHCPLDLWPEAFPVDAVARSLLGDTGMFIARLPDHAEAPLFRIIVDQTMAAYAARLFARA